MRSPYAGADRVQGLLAMSLPECSYEVTFACLLPDESAVERQSENVESHNFPMKHRWDFGPARKVARLVRSEGFNLLLSHTIRSAMIAAKAGKLTGIPYIHHVHYQMNTEVDVGLRMRVNTSIERLACQFVDRTIAVSRSIELLSEQRVQSNSGNSGPQWCTCCV